MTAAERVVVGRKTPGDGKLEISREFADLLGGDGAAHPMHVDDETSLGTVSVMSCTCAKASQTGTHEHYFLQCDLFRALPVGRALVLQH
ncbi:MAG: hypothetical protein ACT4R6_07185, partial [Gemmatimonadaceae bacterium]